MLGSHKFLIFGIVSVLVFAFVIVSASAEERVNDAPMLRSLSDPTFTFTTNSEVLGLIYDYLVENGYTSLSNALPMPDFYNVTNGITIVALYGDNDTVFQVYNGQGHASAWGRVWGFDDFSTLDFFVNDVGLSATFFSSSGEDFVLGGMLPLFASITDIGSALVSFVMSNAIVLIPVVAFVAVLGFSVTRRLIKGV